MQTYRKATRSFNSIFTTILISSLFSCTPSIDNESTLVFSRKYPDQIVPTFNMVHGDQRIASLDLSADGRSGWSVGNSGEIRKYNGHDWILDPQGSGVTKLDLLAVQLIENSNEAWAFGRDGIALHFKNGVWKTDEYLSNFSTGDWNDCWFDSTGQNGYVVGNWGKILELKNGKWKILDCSHLFKKTMAMLYPDLQGIDVSDDMQVGYIVGKRGTILEKEGHEWKNKKWSTNPYITNFWDVAISANGKTGWICGGGGTILELLGNGEWDFCQHCKGIPDVRLTKISLSKGGGDGWMIGSHGTILACNQRKWGKFEVPRLKIRSNLLYACDWDETTGLTWIAGEGNYRIGNTVGEWKEYGILPLGTNNMTMGMWFSPDLSFGWAVGRDGNILSYDSCGWHEVVHSFGTEWFQEIWVNRKGDRGWAVGEGGMVLEMVNGKWQPDTIASALTKGNLMDIWLRDDLSNGLIVGTNGVSLRYLKNEWQLSTETQEPTLRFSANGLWMDKYGTSGWAVGEKGGIFEFNGVEWRNYSKSNREFVTDAQLTDLWIHDSGKHGWAVGDRVILRFENGKWAVHRGSMKSVLLEIYAVDMNNDGTFGYAVGRRGSILKYEGSEKKWTLVPESGKISRSRFSALWLDAESKNGWIGGYSGTLINVGSFDASSPSLEYPLGKSPFSLVGPYILSTYHSIDSAKISIRTTDRSEYFDVAIIAPIQHSNKYEIVFNKDRKWALRELSGKNCVFDLTCWYINHENSTKVEYSSIPKPGPISMNTWGFIEWLLALLAAISISSLAIFLLKYKKPPFFLETLKSGESNNNDLVEIKTGSKKGAQEVSKECLEFILHFIWDEVVRGHCKMELACPLSQSQFMSVKKSRKPFKLIAQEQSPAYYGLPVFPDSWTVHEPFQFGSASLVNYFGRLAVEGQTGFEFNRTLNAIAAYYYMLNGSGPAPGEKNTSEQNYVYLNRFLNDYRAMRVKKR